MVLHKTGKSDFEHYLYLIAKPEKWRKQLYLKGRNMTVGQLVYTMRANSLSIEEAALDMDLPVEQVREAQAYYETHRELIEAEADEEKRFLLSEGVSLEPAPVSLLDTVAKGASGYLSF